MAKVSTLEKETFSCKTVPLEMRLVGEDIVLELVHIDNPKKQEKDPEYSVHLGLGKNFSQGIGHFKNEANARKRYEQCVNALKNGGRISVRGDFPKIYDSSGNLVTPLSYGTEAEDI